MRERGDYRAALEQYQRSLTIAEGLGDRMGISMSRHQIGMIHQKCGDYETASEQFEQSLAIAKEQGGKEGVASSLGQIGKLFAQTERYAEAFPMLLKSLYIFIELQSPSAESVQKVW